MNMTESMANPASFDQDGIDPDKAADLATILAALRFYQRAGQGEPENRDIDIHDIATNGGAVISLDANGIDDLCERLNAEALPVVVVVVDMEGGLINEVRSTIAMRVIVLDADTEGGDEDQIASIEGHDAYISDHETEADPDVSEVARLVDAHYAATI